MIENKVRKYRKALNMTLEQLAEKSDIPVSTISDIENGAEPRVKTAIFLARALHTTVERLWLV